jgi:hypothetical protein
VIRASVSVRALVLSCLLIGVPDLALACPVCFGDSSAPMASATNTGIIFMLGVVGVVLTGFASFIVYLIRRANRLAAHTSQGDAGALAPSEGTAQC